MTNDKKTLQAVGAPNELRSISEIIADLSRPVNPQRLKSRKQGNATLQYLAWYEAANYLDHFAPGWTKEIRSIQQIGDNLVMIVRVTIRGCDGVVWREASALEPIKGSGYGDAAVNCESAAFRRACAMFGLARHLYSSK